MENVMENRKVVLFVIVTVICVLLVICGLVYYNFESKSIHISKRAELRTIALMKANQINQWRMEKISDATVMSKSPFLVHAIESWLGQRDNMKLKNELIVRFKTNIDQNMFEDVLIVSTTGKVLFSSKQVDDLSILQDSSDIFAAIKTHSIIFTDLYRNPKNNKRYSDIIAPVISRSESKKQDIIMALLVLHIDSDKFLTPLLQSWPVPAKSAETQVVRRDGDSVLYLSELRYIKNSAFNYRVPMSNKNAPAVRAVNGSIGIYEGRDYRGIEVLSDIEPIPGTPWFLIVKMDKSEIFSEINYRSSVISILLFTLFGILFIGLGLLYNLWQKDVFKALFEREKENSENLEMFKTTLYSIGDGVITADKNSNVKHMNPVAEHLTGWKECDAQGKPLEQVFKIINEHTRKEVENPAEKVLREGVIVGMANHTVLISKDGKETPIADSGAPIKIPNGEIIGVVLVFRDQSEELAHFRALQESELRFRTIFNRIPVGIAQVSLDFHFQFANPAYCSMLGYTEEEMVGKHIKDVTHPDVVESNLNQQEKLVNGEIDHYEMEKCFVHKNGHILYGLMGASLIRDYSGKPAYTLGTVVDITERKKVEDEIAAEKERLAVTLRSIGDGVITTDMVGRVVVLNKVAEALTGWSQDEAQGRPLSEVFRIVNELTREPCEDPVAKVLKTGEIIELANHTSLISKDGHEIIIADSGAPIRDRENRIIGVVLVFRDETEKRRLNDTMQRAQKLESLGILAAGIAHDFNNLLGGMFGYVDMARECLAQNNSRDADKNLMKSFSVYDRTRDLTRQLLTFSKGGAPVRNVIDLASVIESSAQFALSGTNCVCQLDVENGLWACECDENQIGQVIDNIVINAQQAMPMGGKITVIARNVVKEPVKSGAQSHGGGKFIEIAIKDKGIGISKEMLGKIFDPFFTTKSKGHGLGLATVHSIVVRHDGWIEVESKPGQGTTFHVFLPASKMTISAPVESHKGQHQGNGKALVMDDEDFIRESTGAMLESMGYEVAMAQDGQEAISLLTRIIKEGNSLALAILDLTIPGGMGGLETIAEIRKIDEKVIAVVSSGYGDDPVVADPSKYGFSAAIVKPFRKNELVELLKRLNA
jgi:PAS domain S-box-containing protein